MKCVDMINPSSKKKIINGDRNPHTDHIAMMDEHMQVRHKAVAVGIIRGQYISHFRDIFFTNGNQKVKYKQMVMLAAKLNTAKLRATRFTLVSFMTTFHMSK